MPTPGHLDYYSPSDSSTLKKAIHAAYRHLHGNCYVMDNERAANWNLSSATALSTFANSCAPW